jgi:hypothetical protein
MTDDELAEEQAEIVEALLSGRTKICYVCTRPFDPNESLRIYTCGEFCHNQYLLLPGIHLTESGWHSMDSKK